MFYLLEGDAVTLIVDPVEAEVADLQRIAVAVEDLQAIAAAVEELEQISVNLEVVT
jgi:hypothetical protein